MSILGKTYDNTLLNTYYVIFKVRGKYIHISFVCGLPDPEIFICASYRMEWTFYSKHDKLL